MFEVAHVEDGQGQFYEPKMAWTLKDTLATRLTIVAALCRAEVLIFGSVRKGRLPVVLVQAIRLDRSLSTALDITPPHQTKLN